MPESGRKMGWFGTARKVVVAVGGVLFMLSNAAHGYTKPEDVVKLEKFRDAMLARNPSTNWRTALSTWTCPTDPSNSDGECDPCGRKAWGNWDHIACRGDPLNDGWEFEVPGNGVVTNIHITDLKIEGLVPMYEMCQFKTLREFDLDGGWLEGPIPSNYSVCFPDLQEIDLSYNRLNGTVPPEISKNENLKQFKVEVNDVPGQIPPELGQLKHIQWLRFGENKMNGTVPNELSQTSATLHQLTLDNNDFEGNLYAVREHEFMNFMAQENPKLCGMVPVGALFAHGFNYHNTGLGLPCPDELENGI